jgi:hypothetical protein
MSDTAGIRILPVVFTTPVTNILSVKAEYLIEGDRVKFHFWPDPEFPSEFDSLVKKALRNFSDSSFEVEYIPEVDSWYLCVKDLPFTFNSFFVEALLGKIASAVSDHA